jgi:hypothetical protein
MSIFNEWYENSIKVETADEFIRLFVNEDKSVDALESYLQDDVLVVKKGDVIYNYNINVMYDAALKVFS